MLNASVSISVRLFNSIIVLAWPGLKLMRSQLFFLILAPILEVQVFSFLTKI